MNELNDNDHKKLNRLIKKYKKLFFNKIFKKKDILKIFKILKKINNIDGGLSKLFKKVNIDAYTQCHFTILMMLSKYSRLVSKSVLKTIIKLEVNLDLQDHSGWTALIWAVRYSNTDSSIKTVKMLINAGANLDLQDHSGWTPLMFAGKHSNSFSSVKTVKLLIKSGANLDLKNNRGYTALILAAGHTHNNEASIESVKLLIKAGANLAIINDVERTFYSYLNSYYKGTIIEFISCLKGKYVSDNNIYKSIPEFNKKIGYLIY